MNIPVFPETKVALKGKKGLVVGIANDQSIAWGCAKAFRALGCELALTYINPKTKTFVDPPGRELEAPIVMPLDVCTPGQMEAVFERIATEWGRLDPGALHRLCAQGSIAGPRRRRGAGRLPHHHGSLVLELHPDGAFRRAADEEWRHAFHYDLLRQPDGSKELQHHGSR